MAKASRSETVDATAAILKKNPEASMGEIQKALGKGHNVYPLVIGLARKQLGTGKAAAPRGRPRKEAASPSNGAPGGRRQIALLLRDLDRAGSAVVEARAVLTRLQTAFAG